MYEVLRKAILFFNKNIGCHRRARQCHTFESSWVTELSLKRLSERSLPVWGDNVTLMSLLATCSVDCGSVALFSCFVPLNHDLTVELSAPAIGFLVVRSTASAGEMVYVE